MSQNALVKYDPFQPILPPQSSDKVEAFTESQTENPNEIMLTVDVTNWFYKKDIDSNKTEVNDTFYGYYANSMKELYSPIPIVKRNERQYDRYTVLQKWEGTVVKVTDDKFIARLVDITNTNADEEAEFPIDEVPFEDRSLMIPGAIFYWSILYCDRIGGQRTRGSDIRFRRLPVWKDDELKVVRENAKRTRDLLNWK